MEYMVVVLAIGFILGAICLVITRGELSDLRERFNSHQRSKASVAHAYEPMDFNAAYITIADWCELRAKVESKQDKPLLRRSTDVKHNRRKGDKK